MSDPTVNLDFLGKEIKEGSFLVFPTRRSSSLWMQLAKVIKSDNDGVTVLSAQKRWNDDLFEVNTRVGKIDHSRAIVTEISEEIKKIFEKKGKNE